MSRNLGSTDLKRLHREWRRRHRAGSPCCSTRATPFNVGAILRTAAAYASSTSGSAARPPARPTAAPEDVARLASASSRSTSVEDAGRRRRRGPGRRVPGRGHRAGRRCRAHPPRSTSPATVCLASATRTAASPRPCWPARPGRLHPPARPHRLAQRRHRRRRSPSTRPAAAPGPADRLSPVEVGGVRHSHRQPNQPRASQPTSSQPTSRWWRSVRNCGHGAHDRRRVHRPTFAGNPAGVVPARPIRRRRRGCRRWPPR